MANSKFAKTRTEIAKEKIVVFSLEKEMSMPLMLNKGYRREEIISLFKQLEDLLFGMYIPGKRGRSNPAKFYANDKCPEEYTMTFKVFRNRKTRQEKEKEVTETSSHDSLDDKITKTIATSLPKLKMEEFPQTKSNNKGYALGSFDGKVFLVRTSDGGFDSIEKAVKASWSLFDGKVPLFKSRIMNQVSQVASTLRGLGYVSLTKGE